MPLPTITEKSQDRRRLPRHRVQDTVFVTFRPRFDVVGHLVDISDNGIAIEYTAFEPGERAESVDVDIFCQPRKLNVPHLPCKVAYDLKVEDAPTFRGFQTRRCGLEFGQISPNQREQLKALFEPRIIDTKPSPADDASDLHSPLARRLVTT
ncbi:MAG: PilZ domain-containing protein [Syntrophobacteraceae bacterium]